MYTLKNIQDMTRAQGEGWGYPHVQRVLALIDLISPDVPHDTEVLTWATYLHDWGAFPNYRQSNVPHALRSRQVAEADILPQTQFTADQKAVLLEAIEKHDYQDLRAVVSAEARLLREADWLDMLGAIGIARDFAWGPNNLQVCYDRIIKHKLALQSRFSLPVAKQMAAERIAHMEHILEQITADSFAIL